MIVKLSHIGHAVRDSKTTLKIYADFFGLGVTRVVNVQDQYTIGSMLTVGDSVIEIQGSTSPKGPVSKFLARKPEGLYYAALVVDDLEKQIDLMRAKNVEPLIYEVSPSGIPFKAAWILPGSSGGVLFELVQEGHYKWVIEKDATAGHIPEKSEIVRISHFGHVVKNLDDTLEVYARILDLRPTCRRTVPWGGGRGAMLPIGNNQFIELLELAKPKGLIDKFLTERGQGLYQVSFIVTDMEKEVEVLTSNGAELLESEPTSNFPFKSVCVQPKSTNGVLFELLTEEMLRYIFQKG